MLELTFGHGGQGSCKGSTGRGLVGKTIGGGQVITTCAKGKHGSLNPVGPTHGGQGLHEGGAQGPHFELKKFFITQQQ